MVDIIKKELILLIAYHRDYKMSTEKAFFMETQLQKHSEDNYEDRMT